MLMEQRCTVWKKMYVVVSTVGRTSEGVSMGAGCAGSSANTEALIAWWQPMIDQAKYESMRRCNHGATCW